MLASNHSSQMAYDGFVIGTSVFLEVDPPRAIKAMVEHYFAVQPLYAETLMRLGQAIGRPENCKRLLREGHIVLTFPEGELGGGKLIWNRYKLVEFSQGIVRIALETNTPIVPVGFIGGEEMVPSVSRMTPLAKALGWTYIPLSPSLIFPLPTKCSIYYGKPLYFEGDPFDSKQLPDILKF